MWNAIGSKAQKVAQGMSSAVAEIQKDLKDHRRSGGGDGHDAMEFDEAEAYKQMLVSFQIDQAKLGKEIQAALREKEDEAEHWKKLYAKTSGEPEAAAADDGETNGNGAGALGVDERVKLQAEVDVLTSVNSEWESKLKEALKRSTEEAALRMKLEHETAALNTKVMELDTARAASEDLILSLSAEKTRMLGSSGEANETIDSLVDEYSRLASEHQAQRQMDAETIRRLENVRDELVEKLKAHERNILQLLQKGEQAGAMSQEMTEKSVVEKKPAKEASSSSSDSEEVQKRLEEQAEELRAEKDAALLELRQMLALEAAETVKKEKESALSLAAEGQAAAMKRAVAEAASAAERRAAAALETALAEAKALAEKEKTTAIEALSLKKESERQETLDAARKEEDDKRRKEVEALRDEIAAAATAHANALSAAVAEVEERLSKEVKAAEAATAEASKAAESSKEELTRKSAEALKEQEERLEQEAAAKVDAAKKALSAEIKAAKTSQEEANALYAKENRARKAIHNRLMDLQGNIRVLARVRPILEVERNSGKDIDVTSFPAEEDIVVRKPKESLSGGGGGSGGRGEEKTETRFEFDRVFKPDSSQENVFQAVSPLVTSVLDGYNVCIFAYGQTGSGKTFTMEGPDSNPGVNTRALTDMFQAARDRSEDVTYTFHMSMMEIYNETVFDLLRADNKSKTSLDIRQTQGGGTNVPGLTEVPVVSMADVSAQLERGGKNRAVGAHDMNEHSSRSHMIFNVKVEGTNVHTGAVLRAKLNLIDLAGSERVSKTDATGDRLREAQNINRSLSALGDVISSLSQGKGHVPFRNSKLTFVLQDALSGKSKVMMFVNVSPASYNVTETLCSLNFAARCRSVKLGVASKNQEAPELARYRRANEALHAQLVSNGIAPTVSVGDVSSSGSNPSPSKNTSSLSARRKSMGSDGGSSASSSRAGSPPSSAKGK